MISDQILKPVIVIGAGGHAKVLIEVLRLTGRVIIGILDPHKPAGSEYSGCAVLGDDNELSRFSPDHVEIINGIGSVPGKELRWKLAASMEENGYRFSQVIHPTAVISDDVKLGQGVQIMAGVIIQPGTQIGNSCIINTGAIIDHDCIIHENVHLAPGVTLSGGVIVGKGTHIGTASAVIQAITIGDHCVIGSGSIIYKNVPDNIKVIQQLYPA